MRDTQYQLILYLLRVKTSEVSSNGFMSPRFVDVTMKAVGLDSRDPAWEL